MRKKIRIWVSSVSSKVRILIEVGEQRAGEIFIQFVSVRSRNVGGIEVMLVALKSVN